MLETDPIAQATTALQAAVDLVLRGGDPNLLKPAYMALLRARGNGKAARAVEGLERLPYVKPAKR